MSTKKFIGEILAKTSIEEFRNKVRSHTKYKQDINFLDSEKCSENNVKENY